jgi:hypothetical protein
MVSRWTSKVHRGCVARTNLVVDNGGEEGGQLD